MTDYTKRADTTRRRLARRFIDIEFASAAYRDVETRIELTFTLANGKTITRIGDSIDELEAWA